MKKNIVTFLTISLLISAIGISGCSTPRRYHTESIQKEFEMPPLKDNPVSDTPLSLSKVIEIVKKNNPDIKAAKQKILYTQAVLKAARAGFYPKITIYSEYVQGDSPSSYLFKTIDQRNLPGGTDFNDPGWFENYESGVAGVWPLFNGGRTVLGHKIAQNSIKVSELSHAAIQNNIMAETIKIYYDTLAAESFIQTVTASVETVSSQLNIMNIRFKSGGALKSDILSLKFRLAQAKESLVRSKNHHKILKAGLLNILGASPTKTIRLKKENISPATLPDSYETAYSAALRHHPELERVKKELINKRIAVDMARLSRLPTLHLKAKYYRDDDSNMVGADDENWTAALMLNFDLFTGFKKTAEKEKEVAKLREMLIHHRKTLLSVQYELKKAYLQLEEADERLDVSKKNVATANETFKIVKQQYEGGSTTITRYLEAELSVSKAELSTTHAFYDKQKAYAEIGRATGLIHQLFHK